MYTDIVVNDRLPVVGHSFAEMLQTPNVEKTQEPTTPRTEMKKKPRNPFARLSPAALQDTTKTKGLGRSTPVNLKRFKGKPIYSKADVEQGRKLPTSQSSQSDQGGLAEAHGRHSNAYGESTSSRAEREQQRKKLRDVPE